MDTVVVRARATRDLVQGDELTINYHGSVQEMIHYLFYYGFVPNENVQHIMYFHTVFDISTSTETNINYLMDALAIMGLPRTDQFALPATSNDSLPAAWIYLLYIQELWQDGLKTGNYQPLINVSEGKSLRLTTEQERRAWCTLTTSVETSTQWYTNAMKACKQREMAEETQHVDDTLLLVVYAIALKTLRNTTVAVAQGKADSGN